MKKNILILALSLISFSLQSSEHSNELPYPIGHPDEEVKFMICHYDIITGNWTKITVPLGSVLSHLEHGDKYKKEGVICDSSCKPLDV